MIFALNYLDHSVTHQDELRQWYSDNGLLHSALDTTSYVDAVAGTLTVGRRVASPGQEDLDFPEFACDGGDAPVFAVEVVALTVMPLPWMLTMTGIRSLVGHPTLALSAA